MKHKIIVLGSSMAGKTKVCEALKGKQFRQAYKRSFALAFEFAGDLVLWDTAEQESGSVFLKDPKVILYCVDLATIPSNRERELQKIREVIKLHPNAPIILVGTKSDIAPTAATDVLSGIIQELHNEWVTVHLATSAKTGLGFTTNQSIAGEPSEETETLHACIKAHLPKPAPAPRVDQKIYLGHGLDIPLDEPTKNLIATLNATQSLTSKQRNRIAGLTQELYQRKSENLQTRLVDIDYFVNQCQIVLEGKHPNVMKAVYSVAEAAIVTGVIIGLGVAFGAPICVALLASAFGVGLAAGGLGLYSLFSKSAQNKETLGSFYDTYKVPPPAQ